MLYKTVQNLPNTDYCTCLSYQRTIFFLDLLLYYPKCAFFKNSSDKKILPNMTYASFIIEDKDKP